MRLPSTPIAANDLIEMLAKALQNEKDYSTLYGLIIPGLIKWEGKKVTKRIEKEYDESRVYTSVSHVKYGTRTEATIYFCLPRSRTTTTLFINKDKVVTKELAENVRDWKKRCDTTVSLIQKVDANDLEERMNTLIGQVDDIGDELHDLRISF